MKKRLIAFFSMFALLLGVFAFGAAASTTEGDGMYDVGYAKVNVNPWIQTAAVEYLNPVNDNAIGIPDNSANWTDSKENVHYIKVTDPANPDATVEVPFVTMTMPGYGSHASPSYASLLDDNGDGIVGLGDGLYATVTTVTDDWGSTVIYITIDSTGGYAGLTTSLRSAIPAALEKRFGKSVITGDKIMVSANHSHNTVNIDTCRGDYLKMVDKVYINQDENGNATTAWGAYFQYYLKTVTDAAVEAYTNAVPAVMSKGAIDVSDKLGYQMNFVRHYDVKIDYQDGTSETGLVSGANFGPTKGDRIVNTTAGSSVSYVDSGESYHSHLYEADDMLYVLQFDPVDNVSDPEGEPFDPVVFVNWRAHSTIVSGSSTNYLSADYASSLRRYMEEAGFRPAFWQGAAGNLVPSSLDSNVTKSKEYWLNYEDSNNANLDIGKNKGDKTYQAVLYGKLLTEATQKCLATDNMTKLTAGPIRTKQIFFNADLLIVEEGSGMAAAALQWEKDGKPSKYYFPMEYTHTDNKTYVLNSYYHATRILSRYYATNTKAMYEFNAISMGESVALVTSPFEMFDRYDLERSDVFEANDWLELAGDTYGTPFVLGYTNAHSSYLSNVSGYHYNENAAHYAPGCYEANTSIPAEGSGEAAIQTYKTMLSAVTNGYKEGKCSICGQPVIWEPLLSTGKLEFSNDGHYYLPDDATVASAISIPENSTVCLDLNGHKLTSTKRVFSLPATSTLNFLDSVGTGWVISTAYNSAIVGVISLFSGTCNIYGGTFDVIETENATPATGGLFGVQEGGNLNIYGGTLYGVNLSYVLNNGVARNGCGGAIYLYSGGNVLIGEDARIVSGTVPAHGAGACIYANDATSTVTLQGSANVDEIYYPAVGGASLTVSGAYTGTAKLQLGPDVTLTNGMDIGVSDNADLSGANVSLVNDETYKLVASGADLLLKNSFDASVNGTTYEKLQDALVAAQAGQTVTLLFDITDAITIPDKAITLDLNGCDMSSVTVTGTAASFKDSMTDDYSVADGDYGKIAALNGTATAAEGYMAVTGTDGTSFHKVDLKITAMSLRASVAGVYYKSSFLADEVAAKYIKQYGIALSVKGEPNETNMGSTSSYSAFYEFASGDATGTLLKNIMKTGNTDANNTRNANMAVYGRPYILTTDNKYIFGKTVQRSLKEQLEAIDANWESYSDAAQETVLWMYKRFQSTMSSWNLPNIKYDADPANDGILKVLIVGNSHGLDSTNLLGEVFKDQGMKSEEYVIGALYTSGCRMDQHADFMTNNRTYESYHENGGPDDTNGDAWTKVSKPTPNVAFDNHQWDIVIVQQQNHHAGVENQYVKSQFETVINYIYDHQIGIPKLGWQMLWANPDDYATYLNDDAPLMRLSDPASWRNVHEAWHGTGETGSYKSINMYNNVVTCTQKFITDSTDFLGKSYFDFVIPAATTIQYARDVLDYEQAELYRDYTHLSDFGRLMSAYTWYGKIMECVTGTPVTISNVGISAIPAGLRHPRSTYPTADSSYAVTTQMQSDIKTAANWALAHPYELLAAE